MDILSFLLGLAKGRADADRPDDINKALDNVLGEVVGEQEYTVSFYDYDGTFLCETKVLEGYSSVNPISTGLITTPVKPNTRYEEYTFVGWSRTIDGNAESNALTSVTADRTLYAVYKTKAIYVDEGEWVKSVTRFGVTYYYADMQWNINPDYVLTFSGVMEAYPTEEDGRPWEAYADQITKIVINTTAPDSTEAVKTFNCPSFSAYTSLKEIDLTTANIQSISWSSTGHSALEIIRCSDQTIDLLIYPQVNPLLTHVYLSAFNGWRLYESNIAGTYVRDLTAEEIASPEAIAQIIQEGFNDQGMNAYLTAIR